MNGEEDTCFYLKSFHVFISNSANKGTFFFAILRYCCLCYFKTSSKVYSNLNFFLNVFKRYWASALKVRGVFKCNHVAIRNSCIYIFFLFVEPSSKNGKSVYQ